MWVVSGESLKVPFSLNFKLSGTNDNCCRIEDNILITADGYENLTSVIKEVDELEKLISSS